VRSGAVSKRGCEYERKILADLSARLAEGARPPTGERLERNFRGMLAAAWGG
jgi:hypothetical protein